MKDINKSIIAAILIVVFIIIVLVTIIFFPDAVVTIRNPGKILDKEQKSLDKEEKNLEKGEKSLEEHFDDPKAALSVGAIAEKMKPFPKGDNWSLEYDQSRKIFVVKVDIQRDYAVYQKGVEEALAVFSKNGYDPCKEPIAAKIEFQATNLPLSPPSGQIWEPCK